MKREREQLHESTSGSRSPSAEGRLRLLPGGGQRLTISARRTRETERRPMIQLLRLEDLDEHGLACFVTEGARWRWPLGARPRRTSGPAKGSRAPCVGENAGQREQPKGPGEAPAAQGQQDDQIGRVVE